MAKGGARPGAGRKKGTVSRQTKEKQALAARVARAGITPLEVMVTAMRDAWERKDVDKACAIAKDAAPYIHPRLATTQLTGADGGPIQVDVNEAFDKLAQRLEEAAAASAARVTRAE